VANAAAGMRGHAKRFTEIKSETDADIGPGAYDNHIDSSVSARVASQVSKSSRSNAGFGTRSQARELPYAKALDEVPGPGSYQAAKSSVELQSGHGSSFKSESQRLQVEDADIGDPGAYDPYASREIAAESARSFGRSNKKGAGGFGGMSAREMKVDIFGENTPGPGSYDSKRPQQDSKERQPSSAFRSGSVQRAKTRNADTPGAGAYNPNATAVEPSVANAAAGMRGHAKRFTEIKSETDAEVGPGAYDNVVTVSGTSATVSGRVATQVKTGGSAVFTSDSVRDLPY